MNVVGIVFGFCFLMLSFITLLFLIASSHDIYAFMRSMFFPIIIVCYLVILIGYSIVKRFVRNSGEEW